MSKQINFRISADTKDAEREIKSLQKGVGELSKEKLKIGVDTQTVGNAVNENSKEENIGFEELKNEARNLSSVMERLIKAINDSKDDNKTSSSSNGSNDNSDASNADEKKKKKLEKETDTLGDRISKVSTVIGGITGVFRLFGSGARKAADLESEALRIYNRTGVYGSDFNAARKEAYSVGRKYGYSNTESLYTQDELLKGGFTNKDNLGHDTGSIMATARAYGLDVSELTAGFNERVRLGTFSTGEADEYTKILANSIKQNDMVGRESEQIQALNELVDILTKGKINVSSEDFKNIAGYQAILADIAPQLKGSKGAEILEQGSSFFNENDQTLLMAAGYGGELGYGLDALWEAKKRVERAKQLDPEAISLIMNGLKNNLGVDDITALHLIKNSTGMSTDDTEVYYNAIENGDVELAKEIADRQGNNQDELLKNASKSKALKQEQFGNDAEDAKINAGNVQNEATEPYKDIYSDLPSPLRTVGTALASVGAWTLGGKFAGKALKGLTGASAATAASGAAKGVTAGAGALGTISKLAPKLGGVGLALAGIRYGAETIGHLQEGEDKEATGAGIAGLGSIVGGLGGAQLGAIAGTAIAPGIGTVIGGALGGIAGNVGGSKLGRVLGEGLYGLLNKDSNVAYADSEKNKDKSIVDRKESLVKRTENILDRVENGELLNVNIEDNGKEDRTSNYKKDINNSSNYASGRNRSAYLYAQNKMNPGVFSSTGPLLGSDNEEKIWNFFKNQGFSDAATAGIMGNFAHESGLEPARNQDGGGPGHGLAQWEKDRFTNLQEFANKKGKNWSDLQTQLEFVMQELKTNHSASWVDDLKNTNNVNYATESFQDVYERPGVPHTERRIGYARDIYRRREELSNASSYAIGNDRVDEDQFAYIHKDEAILDRFKAREYREKGIGNEAIQEFPNFEEDLSSNESISNNQITINLQPTINAGDSNVSSEIKDMIIKGIKQAMKEVQANNSSFKLNQTYNRVPI